MALTNENIINLAKQNKIEPLLNKKRIAHLSKEAPKSLRKLLEKNDFVILGSGNVKDFHNQPVVVIPISDYFGQLKSVRLPRETN